MYGVSTVFLAGKSPHTWSNTVYIYGSGQLYIYTPCLHMCIWLINPGHMCGPSQGIREYLWRGLICCALVFDVCAQALPPLSSLCLGLFPSMLSSCVFHCVCVCACVCLRMCVQVCVCVGVFWVYAFGCSFFVRLLLMCNINSAAYRVNL